MPKLIELSNSIIDLVADELEVSRELILSKCRTAEVVDARHLAIRILHSKDIYPARIAVIFGLSPRSIHYIITQFDTRLQVNKSLRNIYAKIAKQLGCNCETTLK